MHGRLDVNFACGGARAGAQSVLMQAAKGKFRGILLITAGLMAFGWQVTTKADSWQRPQEFDTASENGKFVARVVPATQDRKGVLIVSDLKSGKTDEIWRTQLSNNVAPTEVRLTNDGESVLTLDNWFGAGYGDDVVAIYNRHGQLTKYSLEQIDAGTKSKTNQTTEPAIQSEGESSLAGIRTSTSSR